MVGEHLHDAFFDGHREEADTLNDIMDLIAGSDGEYVTLIFHKKFLRKIVHSHILRIMQLEK